MNFLIHHWLDDHARRQPKSLALECREETLTYEQLAVQSNQVAHYLIDQDVNRGDRIGIYLDKCVNVGVALYGILKSGCAYVPLDPDAPIERLWSIIIDCGINVIVSQESKAKKLRQLQEGLDFSLFMIGLESLDEHTGTGYHQISWTSIGQTYPIDLPKVKVIESDLAYIIYTSGSTGQPKGIMHSHHSCLSYSRWAADEYDLVANDKLGNHSPLHFDISIFDFFAGIIAGACTVLIPNGITKFPASYTQLLETSRITVLFTVPFALIQLSLRGSLETRDLSSLRWLIFGGEPFPIKHLKALMQKLPHVSFDNMYGPAEVNGCTHYLVTELDNDIKHLPIGAINQISEAAIVDDNNNPVELGEIGELLVRTPSMMQGYWNRDDLNRQAFHFAKGNDGVTKRFYRTGDLVSSNQRGEMTFAGRKDRQIKVRGYRIELDEIEMVLAAHDAVEEAAVFPVRKSNLPVEIYAAYTLKDNIEIATNVLTKYLKAYLPSYALPSHLSLREDFPRTTSEKINRTALSREAEYNNV